MMTACTEKMMTTIENKNIFDQCLLIASRALWSMCPWQLYGQHEYSCKYSLISCSNVQKEAKRTVSQCINSSPLRTYSFQMRPFSLPPPSDILVEIREQKTSRQQTLRLHRITPHNWDSSAGCWLQLDIEGFQCCCYGNKRAGRSSEHCWYWHTCWWPWGPEWGLLATLG